MSPRKHSFVKKINKNEKLQFKVILNYAFYIILLVKMQINFVLQNAENVLQQYYTSFFKKKNHFNLKQYVSLISHKIFYSKQL